MAKRIIRVGDDEILRKKSKEVKEINQGIIDLLDDMYDTMVDADGVGIAAVQVGVLKKIVIVEVEEDDEFVAIEMINPEILEQGEETQVVTEGCLSVPNKTGEVNRPKYVKVKYRDREWKEHVEDFYDLGAVVVSHEVDHLSGILYIDKATNVRDEEISNK